jgi:hypothetical protein
MQSFSFTHMAARRSGHRVRLSNLTIFHTQMKLISSSELASSESTILCSEFTRF